MHAIIDKQPGWSHPELMTEDCEFIESKLPIVSGWLLPGAAYFTTYLLSFQSLNKVRGPAVEIGVYHGKYLLLLLHSLSRDDEWVGGYDIFQACHPETAWRDAETMFGSRERMALWKVDSRKLDQDRVLRDIGAPPRFFSVDGEHTVEAVVHDIGLASSVLAEQGVVAVDDFGNAATFEVMEGVFRFLLAPDCDYVPFASVSNKLFLCRKPTLDFYLAAAKGFLERWTAVPIVQERQKRVAEGSDWAFQRLLGAQIVALE